ncbi:MAG: TolC family protein [Bdellovibrionaceae bacterium]|nr:TolC family protein [Pseudobdellovibrionaceae bacterium]
MRRELCFFVVLIFGANSFAEISKDSLNTIEDLVNYSVQNSNDSLISEAEVKVQEVMSGVTKRIKYLPQVNAFASYQNAKYFDNRINQDGHLITNTGVNRVVGASVTYDLQKLFGSEDKVAKAHAEHSEILNKVSKLNMRRGVRKSFALFVQVKSALKEYEDILHFMEKVKGTLVQGKRQGVFSDIEFGQYEIQQGFILADQSAKQRELETIYTSFSLLLNLPVDDVRVILNRIKSESDVVVEEGPSFFKESLSSDYDLAKFELKSFQTIPLPTVYVKSYYQDPTIPSFQGRNHYTELGINIDLTHLFVQAANKSELRERLAKSEALMRKSELEYENNIHLAKEEKKSFVAEEKELKNLKIQTDKMFKKSFLYYSQKRIDILTLMDLAQKNFLSGERLLLNKYQQSLIDADLEYYLGGV